MAYSLNVKKLLDAALGGSQLDGLLAGTTAKISATARGLASSARPDDGSYVRAFGTAVENAPGNWGNKDHLAVNTHPHAVAIELGHVDRSYGGWVDGRHDLSKAAKQVTL